MTRYLLFGFRWCCCVSCPLRFVVFIPFFSAIVRSFICLLPLQFTNGKWTSIHWDSRESVVNIPLLKLTFFSHPFHSYVLCRPTHLNLSGLSFSFFIAIKYTIRFPFKLVFDFYDILSYFLFTVGAHVSTASKESFAEIKLWHFLPEYQTGYLENFCRLKVTHLSENMLNRINFNSELYLQRICYRLKFIRPKFIPLFLCKELCRVILSNSIETRTTNRKFQWAK